MKAKCSLCALALSLVTLASCGGYQVPKTAYEKVSTAFSGVERSFQNLEKSPQNAKKKNKITPSDLDGGLRAIEALYAEGDVAGDSLDGLSYTEPPMIQFRCLKKVVEKIGSSYSFGTKYYDTIQGTVYYDPESGRKMEQSDAYRYDYDFTLAVSVAIQDNDQIDADVLFDITLRQGEKTYHTDWYVAIALTYKMDSESPTYTMSMYVANGQEELPCMEFGNVYEYDYVNMDHGSIVEWRKLGYETNALMVRDAAHASFEDYLDDEGFEVGTVVSRWYKNHVLRRFARDSQEKTNVLAGALFNKLGLNLTDTDAATFQKKQGSKNEVIKSIYQEFSNLFGEDVIYNLIEKGEDSHGHQEPEAVGIAVINAESRQIVSSITIDDDMYLGELFYTDVGPRLAVAHIDEEGNIKDIIEDIDSLNFVFVIETSVGTVTYKDGALSSNYASFFTNLQSYQADAIEKYYLSILERNGAFETKLAFQNGSGILEIIEIAFHGTFPSDLTQKGFVAYEGEKCAFYLTQSQDEYQLKIKYTTEAELNAYFLSLAKAGWDTKETPYDGQGNVINRREATIARGDKQLYVSTQNADRLSDAIILHYSIGEYVPPVNPWASWPTETVFEKSGNLILLPMPTTQNGSYIHDEDAGIIELHDFTDEEIEDFITALCGYEGGWDGDFLTILKEGRILCRFALNVIQGVVYFTYGEHEEYMRLHYSIGYGIAQMDLLPDYSGYYCYTKFEPGVYEVTCLVSGTGEQYLVDIVGANAKCYSSAGVTYDKESKSLTLTQATDLCFYAGLAASTSVSLIELEDAGKFPYQK